jgi:hypothetical protein
LDGELSAAEYVGHGLAVCGDLASVEVPAMSCFISSSLIEPARVIAPFAFRVPDRTMTFTRLPDRKKLAACHPSDSTPRVTPVAANSVVASGV